MNSLEKAIYLATSNDIAAAAARDSGVRSGFRASFGMAALTQPGLPQLD